MFGDHILGTPVSGCGDDDILTGDREVLGSDCSVRCEIFSFLSRLSLALRF